VIAEELTERFFVIGDFVFFDEGDEIGGGVSGQGGFGEVGILREEIFRLAINIGEVAAASAGDEDFFADFFGVFQEEDATVALAGLDGAEEAGGAGTEDDDVEVGQEWPFGEIPHGTRVFHDEVGWGKEVGGEIGEEGKLKRLARGGLGSLAGPSELRVN
jgi:hypothetical protein